MAGTLNGGCACGSVRYSCTESPLAQMLCHCRDCQRASGSAFAALLVVPTDRLTFEGMTPSDYEVVSESGRTMKRRFCQACGSPVAILRPETPAIQFLQAASLDDPSSFAPTCEVWTSRAHEWHPHVEDAERYPEGPSPQAVREPVEAYFAAREK